MRKGVTETEGGAGAEAQTGPGWAGRVVRMQDTMRSDLPPEASPDLPADARWGWAWVLLEGAGRALVCLVSVNFCVSAPAACRCLGACGCVSGREGPKNVNVNVNVWSGVTAVC